MHESTGTLFRFVFEAGLELEKENICKRDLCEAILKEQEQKYSEVIKGVQRKNRYNIKRWNQYGDYLIFSDNNGLLCEKHVENIMRWIQHSLYDMHGETCMK